MVLNQQGRPKTVRPVTGCVTVDRSLSLSRPLGLAFSPPPHPCLKASDGPLLLTEKVGISGPAFKVPES